ncbi:WYL domain-containing protein [Sphingobium sp. SA916]|uniref:WYL domain-containing protein n=1 Tax=Sphingobium sp. SA916 TaxID=1851207 RepID=UPI000C9FF574|nr:WYL domain-containing protein [Sphingobium sp. SA916]PNQ02902.1 transcriptional regulator [Sphingobium sp. SA916]
MDEKLNLRWGVERKLEFIEFRLFWEGYVNRGDIIDTFNVSVNQASTDLNRYLGLAPDNMSYDKSARTYVRTSAFKPLFLKPDASLYLSQVRSLSDGLLDKHEAWIGNIPDFGSIPFPVRGVLPTVLRTLVIAIRRHEAVEVCYQSMSSPEPQWRWIIPHALGFDGFRWHARAFCEQSGQFNDFVLSRIAETKQSRPTDARATNDTAWHELVHLEIGAHPALSDGQRRAIELDYGMIDGQVTIPVRRALLYYALKRLGLDTDPTARRPQDQQIVLLNADKVAPLNGNGADS